MLSVATGREFVAIRKPDQAAVAAPRDRLLIAASVNSNAMSRAKDFTPPIDATVEYETVSFDFGPAFASGVSISEINSVTCSVSALSQNPDADASSRLSGSPSLAASTTTGVAGGQVNQLVGGMVGGVLYLLRAVVETTDGQTLSLWARLYCDTPD
jgi:hypothetical protein